MRDELGEEQEIELDMREVLSNIGELNNGVVTPEVQAKIDKLEKEVRKMTKQLMNYEGVHNG